MKKVLVIGMLDSVHLYRWLSQFIDQDIEFTIFPSTKFKSVHPQLIDLVKKNSNFKFSRARFIFLFGYIEYALNFYLAKVYKRLSNHNRLRNVIARNRFDYIHALEIQGAGYLLVNALKPSYLGTSKIIVTNWGSDIYFFQNIKVHRDKIEKVLKFADYYSAECQRDYELALQNGFAGKFLPLNPNAGGFSPDVFERNEKSAFDRNLIIAKCYGGDFGLGQLIIDSIDKYFCLNDKLSVFFYSVTPDLELSICSLMKKYPNRVDFSSVKNKLSITEMYDKFSNSKVYIGASKSDGISTSFLEALVLGAYPIQTNTSCGNEWVEKGFKAHLVDSNADAIFNALVTLDQFEDLEEKRLENKYLAIKFLNFQSIKQESLVYYGLVN
jgi:Glycosyl transferase 4-like